MILADLDEEKIIFNQATCDKDLFKKICKERLTKLRIRVEVLRNNTIRITDIEQRTLKIPYVLTKGTHLKLSSQIEDNEYIVNIGIDNDNEKLIYYLIIQEQ